MFCLGQVFTKLGNSLQDQYLEQKLVKTNLFMLRYFIQTRDRGNWRRDPVIYPGDYMSGGNVN